MNAFEEPVEGEHEALERVRIERAVTAEPTQGRADLRVALRGVQTFETQLILAAGIP